MTILFDIDYPLELLPGIAMGEVGLMETSRGVTTVLRNSQGIVGSATLRPVDVLTVDEAAAVAAVRLGVGLVIGAVAVAAVGGAVYVWRRHQNKGQAVSAEAVVQSIVEPGVDGRGLADVHDIGEAAARRLLRDGAA